MNMDTITSWLQETMGLNPDIASKLLASLTVIVLVWVLHQLILRAFIPRIEDTRVRYQWKKSIGYILFTVAVLLIGSIWFEWIRSLATYLGILSAGLAVALRDPITDIIGWMFILWRKPFQIGDRIQIGDKAGDVIDIRIFQFTLMEIGNWVDADQSTGRVLHVPNGMVFNTVLANYSRGSDYIWNEIPVLITFESDWEKAKNVLDNIIRKHAENIVQSAEESFQNAARQYMIKTGKLSSTIYTSVKDSGVLLTIRYLCEPRQRRDSSKILWENILREFSKHPDIDFAYPTQRFYNLAVETVQKSGSLSE